MLKIRGTLNWQLTAADMEHPKGESETIQNNAWTIEEILTRFTQGLPLGTGTGIYLDGDEDPDIDSQDMMEFDRMDITEQEELIQDAKARKNESEAKIKAHKAEKEAQEKAAKKARIQAKKDRQTEALKGASKDVQKS